MKLKKTMSFFMNHWNCL